MPRGDRYGRLSQCAVLFATLTGSSAWAGTPQFTAEGVVPRGSISGPRLLAPGLLVTLYGTGLSHEVCGEVPGGATEACGVRVLIGGEAAPLLYVSPGQINFRIPEAAPRRGEAPARVCDRGECSPAVTFRFSTETAFLTLPEHPVAGMPLWILVDEPVPNLLRYPYSFQPWDIGLHEIELRRDGKPVPVRRHGPDRGVVGGLMGGSMAPPDAPPGRLPLHVLYDLSEPGTYPVRFRSTWPVRCESDWTHFVLEPSDGPKRDAWLEQQALRMEEASAGMLLGDILPSLLARPDEKALKLVTRALGHSDPLVQGFAKASLDLFRQ